MLPVPPGTGGVVDDQTPERNTMTTSDARLARITTMRDLEAMVALDNVDLLAQRVTKLLSHGRRMSVTHRYLHTNGPADLKVGLTMERIEKWGRKDAAGVHVHLKPGLLEGFGFAAYAGESDTEAEAWRQYHNHPDDRRNLTHIDITGGLPGDGPARDDHIVVRSWNSDRVCIERVVGFDYDSGRPGYGNPLRELAEWLISMDDIDQPAGLEARRTVTLTRIIDRARQALGEG
jgi:hypothetical protein